MTKLERVIKGLEQHMKKGCLSGREQLQPVICPYFQESDCIIELCCDALELLKEQEPIKPTVAVDTWICSNCGHTLESQTLIDDKENPQVLVNEQYDFCPQCGKAVRWE